MVLPQTVMFTIDSGDRINAQFNPQEPIASVGTTAYNNFVIAKNENLLQGRFRKVAVTALRFPFGIPNINKRNNVLYVATAYPPIDGLVSAGGSWIKLELFEGFYYGGYQTGTGLARILEAQLQLLTGDATIQVLYDVGAFYTIRNTGGSPLCLSPLPKTPTTFLERDTQSLLDVIGMSHTQMLPYAQNASIAQQYIRGGVAKLLYTDYIDICSNALTGNQFANDATTQRFTPRGNLICRVYINNNISTDTLGGFDSVYPSSTTGGIISGTRPFIIYREFTHPKWIKLNNETAIGQIDIQLYDDRGEPLYMPTYFGPLAPTTPTITSGINFKPQADFTLTLLASEED
jgi:hypothetical protein